jgi:hypothetical protein
VRVGVCMRRVVLQIIVPYTMAVHHFLKATIMNVAVANCELPLARDCTETRA